MGLLPDDEVGQGGIIMTTKIRTNRHGLKLIAVAGALLSVAGGIPAVAADLPASVKVLVPAAQKEGSLLVWGTTLNPRQIAAMSKD